MCHEDNQRCAGQVQHLQNVSLAVELRRLIYQRIDERKAVLHDDTRDEQIYGVGIIDGLHIALMVVDELSSDYSFCDNPPEKSREIA